LHRERKKIKIRSKANIENETFLEIGENENRKQVPALYQCMSNQHLYRTGLLKPFLQRIRDYSNNA